MTQDMSIHRTLLAAAALTGAAVAGWRSRPARRTPADTVVRPRARTVCANSSVVVACADHVAGTSRALSPTRVAVCAVTSAANCA